MLVEGTKRLLHAGAEAGVRHHVGISIVGCDRVPMPYYKVKVEQEEAIAAGEVPWSLLRATQFHTLVAWCFSAEPRARRVRRPARPACSRSTRRPPAGTWRMPRTPIRRARLPDLAGPEVHTLTELAETWRAANGRRLLRLRIPTVGRIGRPIGEAALCNRDATAGGRPSRSGWPVADRPMRIRH